MMTSNLILNQSGFIQSNALVMARASASAYADTRRASAGGIDVYDAVTDTYAVLFEYYDCWQILFRGTNPLSLINWITDADFRFESAPGGIRVHAGFHRALESTKGQILKVLAGTGKPIVIGGHSLGGALAVLAADWLHWNGFLIHSVYTFGQPRVGNAAFVKAYNGVGLGDVTYRVVDQCDIVPRCPGWLLGYRHAGVHVFITVTDSLVLNPPLALVALNDAMGLYGAYRRVDDVVIKDHFIERYIAALSAGTGNLSPLLTTLLDAYHHHTTVTASP